jgi:hypothetical protein
MTVLPALCLLVQPTCADTNMTEPGDQPFNCRRAAFNNGSSSQGPPSDELCCLVSGAYVT